MKKSKAICNQNNCYLFQNCIKEWHPAILQNQKTFRVKKGEVIFREGDKVSGIYFVNSGNVKVHKKWDADKELILRFAKTGAILGHRGIGSDTGYPISATALEAGVICYVDMDFFEATLKVNAEFTYKLMQFFASELCESERKMRNLAHMSVKGRVAESLLLLQKQFGVTDDGFINIDLSRQDLASFSGATYETVFRVINELVNEKLLALSGKSIAIINQTGLSKLTMLEVS
ncbi:Crp/Fnr family transcriptional regulator [Mucilaginibacter auburnensis]|uniref:CRP-like cAMP-binding protein n=1 Tax=Mucilaginibacter auburnensis TaxID=1457233 RepID=A0A2H9VQV4_9SPHI|nr:Crp/Fnr family transcriptional regulator [Mucilaginibacter auburnensis]PJJ83148.1 CRP-like cAMP-binding protein [Mucilaginibacter auburnensis]